MVAAGLVVGGSALAESAWEKKLNDARTAAAAQRQKLGLKNDATAPTPELEFSTPPPDATGGVLVIGPGEKKELSFKTKNLPPGSVFAPTTDDVAFSGEKNDKGVWKATATAKANALPRPFEVRAVNAQNGREASIGRLLLAGKHTLVVDAGDAKLTLKLDFSSGKTSVEALGEWAKGGKSLGKATYTVALNDSGLGLERVLSSEEMQAQAAALTASMGSPERKAASAKFEKAMKKLEPCSKLAPEKMAACMNAVQPEIEAANAEMKRVNDAADVANAPKYGCSSITLTYQEGGAVDGDASRCPAKKAEEQVPAKATFTSP
jgi:hypothetical protein